MDIDILKFYCLKYFEHLSKLKTLYDKFNLNYKC